MKRQDQPIQRKLKSILLLTSTIVLLLTCGGFIAYEWIVARQELAQNLSTLAEITAANSTAVLAFANESEAAEVLSKLRVEKNIVAAALYDNTGSVFATYPAAQSPDTVPALRQDPVPHFTRTRLSVFKPVIENGKRLGSLYVESDLSSLYEKFRLYAGIVLLVMIISWLAAFALSAALQKRISQPILALAETAKAISDRKDYSVRANKLGEDELGLLTDAFNQMLNQIQEQTSALRESEARKSAILDSAGDGIISIDHHGNIIEFNPAAQRIFGYTRDQAMGRELAELIVPLFLRERHRRGMAHYLATGEGPVLGHRLELIAQRADGTEFPVELSITRVGSVEPPTFTGFVRDITERKRIEAVRAQFAAIVESSSDAIVGKTIDGRITSWNPGAEKLFGYTAEEAIGKPMLLVIPPELAKEEAEILSRIAHGERIESFETVRLRKDGTRVDVSVAISPIRDSSGKVVGASKIARDITERKQAQKEILRLNAELEQRVLDRTAQLETANKELEGFSYSVSHDLRAPLRGIGGFAQLLAKSHEGKLDPESTRWLGIIQSETQRMGRLIDELLNFSRLGRQQMKSSVIDMTALAQTVFQDLTAHQPEPLPRLDLRPLPPALGDPTLLRQVFANLLANAIKFTRHRESPLIEVGATSEAGGTVYYVKDNGVGFDAKYAHKLFGVFQRLHHEDEFEGTGVGLALVQRIIHRHGGRIWAEAVLDKGATFFFLLPNEKSKDSHESTDRN